MKLKLSKYIIVSEPFYDGLDNKEKVVCFSTRFQNIYTFEIETYNFLCNGELNLLTKDLIKELIAAEILIPDSEDELNTIINRSNAALNDNKSLYYVIQPSAQCQLGCGYCGQTHRDAKIDDSIQQKILERIEEKLKKRKYNELSIGWFGGEPLSAFSSMRRLSNELILLSKKYNCNYTAKVITNGLALTLDKFKVIVNELKISNIEITIDGSDKYHDERRHTKNGSPTFNQIFKNLISISNSIENLNGSVNISVRCNVDRRNVDGVSDLLIILKEQKLQDKINFYCAPIHSWGNDAHKLSFTHQEYGDLEINWLMQMQKLGFRLNLFPNSKPIVCMTVEKDSEVIDAYGNYFSCTEIPYVDIYNNTEHVLGNVLNQSKKNTYRSYTNFHNDIIDDKFDCNKCPMLPVCGGSCPKQWYEGNIPCPSNKFNLGKKLLLHQLILRNEIIEELKKTVF